MTIPKNKRISSARRIQEIIKTGKRVFSVYLSLIFLRNKIDEVRIKVIVPVKLDKRSTVRNSLRRRASEVLRSRVDKIKTGHDVIVILRKEVVDLSFGELEAQIVESLRRSKLL